MSGCGRAIRGEYLGVDMNGKEGRKSIQFDRFSVSKIIGFCGIEIFVIGARFFE